MTVAARRVLEDCKLAVAELAASPDPALWRRRWVAALTLLRSVGHVLDKVDGDQDERLRTAIASWWKQIRTNKDQHPVFWQFVDEERNSILKEYRSRGVHHARNAVRFNMQTGKQLENSMTYSTVIEGGPFNGQSQVDVGEQAIAWWQEQLDSIERSVERAA